MKIYLASSWRNKYYSMVLSTLRDRMGFNVHDFRDPAGHFSWTEIDENWSNWTPDEYISSLRHPKADTGFLRDMGGIITSDVCVLLLPCGRSAHIEAGFMKGQGKKVFALIPEPMEAELMYRLFDGVYSDITTLINVLDSIDGI